MQLEHLFYTEITKRNRFFNFWIAFPKLLKKILNKFLIQDFLQLLAEYKKKRLYEKYIKQGIGTISIVDLFLNLCIWNICSFYIVIKNNFFNISSHPYKEYLACFYKFFYNFMLNTKNLYEKYIVQYYLH